jgi:hypothetical protein
MTRRTSLNLQRRASALRSQIIEQRKWMLSCGNDLAGYVANYGSALDPDGNYYGSGGEAIYFADLTALRALEEQLSAVEV